MYVFLPDNCKPDQIQYVLESNTHLIELTHYEQYIFGI